MGNAEDSQKDENNLEKFDPNEIIENDCYEEIDLKKINKIIEEEKNWNKNSIIYSINDLDLQNLNSKEEKDKNGQNLENKPENLNANDEIFNNVIIEQKNEGGSEDVKQKDSSVKEANPENKNNVEINNNVNNGNKQDENAEEEKNDQSNHDKPVNIIIVDHKNSDDDIVNNTNSNNINATLNDKRKILIKAKAKKPRIRPKNTCDEALNNPGKLRGGKRGKEVKKRESSKDKNKSNNNKPNDNENNKKEEKPKDAAVGEAKEPIEEFDIKNVISEYRLNHLKDDEIIYSGTLEKILKIPQKETIAYSQRFCVFTKNYFAYYKSKEAYISLNKPMLLIKNNNIIRIENTILDGGSYYFGIICEINDETRNLINKVNSFVTEEANTCELLLGFRTNEYENMMKWVIVLRHFITNKNEEF